MSVPNNREELFDLMMNAADTGEIGVVVNRILDALNTAELVVVPVKATEEMVKAMCGMNDPFWEQEFKDRQRAKCNMAIAAGNLLVYGKK